MVQVIEPDFKLEMEFQHYPHLIGQEYMVWIKGEKYNGITVTATSIHECLKELSISIKVLELYRVNCKKQKEEDGKPF